MTPLCPTSTTVLSTKTMNQEILQNIKQQQYIPIYSELIHTVNTLLSLSGICSLTAIKLLDPKSNRFAIVSLDSNREIHGDIEDMRDFHVEVIKYSALRALALPLSTLLAYKTYQWNS